MRLGKQVKKIVSSPAFWILIVATFLRFSLAVVNRESNDNHMEVIQRLLSGQSVDKDDCLECFHPKLYYSLSSFLIRAFSIDDDVDQVIFTQSMNALVGSLTLIFIWKFIQHYQISKTVKHLVFALWAFNPTYIGIHGQASNDALVILLSTISLSSFLKYLDKHTNASLILFSLFAGLASITKINGLFFSAGLLISLLVLLRKGNATRIIRTLLVFGSFVLILVALFSPYVEYMKRYGTPAAHTVPRQPFPHFIDDTYYRRPGITSILSGYFTFRLFDLLKEPHSTNEVENYPLHRTSLWSQLYARSLSVHFQEWPLSWVSHDPLVADITRIIFILGLVPLCVFVLGYFALAQRFFSRKRGSEQDLSVHLVIASVLLGSMVISTLFYRDYSFMKPIYLYPATLSFVGIFLFGIRAVLPALREHRTVFAAGAVALVMLLVVQVTDILLLIHQLL